MQKPIQLKKTKKEGRESRILFGLIELYIESAKPIGSHTLQENGFGDLSSATIRNYCAKLEEMGLLMQQHSSGGRIPTEKAFELFASYCREQINTHEILQALEPSIKDNETKEPVLFINQAIEELSQKLDLATFASSPRFDHDFIKDIKLTAIDACRTLAIIITNFGLIQTETLHSDKKLSSFTLKRIENFFKLKLQAQNATGLLSEQEMVIAETFYHEIIVRYIALHANFSKEDIVTTGFSTLLNYKELIDPQLLANSLSLFENKEALAALAKDTMKKKDLTIYMGDLLKIFNKAASSTFVIAIPYTINHTIAGVIAVCGPLRVPYKTVIKEMIVMSKKISDTLTRSLYKFKLSYRTASTESPTHLKSEDKLLLEDKREENRE